MNYQVNLEYFTRYTKHFKFLTFIIVALLSILFLSFVIVSKYDQITLKALVNCQEKCFVTITSQLPDVNYLSKANHILISNNQYEIINTTIGDIKNDYDNLISYQEITYEIKTNSLPNNQIIEITLLQNKEKLYQKINPFK